MPASAAQFQEGMEHHDPDDTDRDDDDAPLSDEMVEFFECEVSNRRWVRAINAFLEGRFALQTDPNPKVQAAIDKAYIAAAERLTAIFESDHLTEWDHAQPGRNHSTPNRPDGL